MTAVSTVQHNIMQSTPVLSAPNVGTASVRSGNQQVSLPVSAKQEVQNQAEQQVTAQGVQQAIQQANQALSRSGESIAFGYEEKLGQLFVTVTDKESGEVIREIPSKDFIQHKVFMKEMVGLLLDKQA